MDIYGQYKDSLEAVMRMMAASMERYAKAHKDDSGELIYEHLRYRLKSEKSMQAKLERKVMMRKKRMMQKRPSATE